MTHSELCQLAKKWLTRPNSQSGHGCQFALTECRSGYGGEMPDAIGYRATSNVIVTVVVEVKTSRADFLADSKKPHRAEGKGMGLYRYYMCPEGLIKPEELPPRWGLVWVNARGHIKVIAGPPSLVSAPGTKDEDWLHTRDTDRETWLLVRVMARINDPDKMKNALNEALREKAYIARRCDSLVKEVNVLSKRISAMQYAEWERVSADDNREKLKA